MKKISPKTGRARKALNPKRKIRPKAGRADGVGKQIAALPRWVWAVAGVVALGMVIFLVLLLSSRKEGPATPSSSVTPGTTAGTGGNRNGQPPASAVFPDAGVTGALSASIQAVRLQPSQPTRLDSLKAEVERASDAPEQLVYTYLWKVNGRTVEEAGDTLNLSNFKKGDLITVTVTPYHGIIAGWPVESPVVSIHRIPPSLEMKAGRQARRIGKPMVLQLVGAAPDGGGLTFSLETPYVPGMTIDKRTGEISWLSQPDQKGTFRFGAAVEDEDQTKVTKIFSVTAE